MQTSPKSKGILIFAHGRDYLKLAWNARFYAQNMLHLPITLVTSESKEILNSLNWAYTSLDNVITVEKPAPNISPRTKQEWLNRDRVRAYELTPYDETLVIDADYMVHSDKLLSMFGNEGEEPQSEPWLMASRQIDVHTSETVGEEFLGKSKIPMRLATVLYFKKPEAEPFFELVQTVMDNWKFYAEWLGFDARFFRNDYAFTIADWLLHGKTSGPHWPVPICTVMQPCTVISQMTQHCTIQTVFEALKDPALCWNVGKIDMHWICKQPLLDYMEKPPSEYE